jgi:succinate-semialdehyde dehydrogenase/glutarate-semialdehyde dehydrogenase
VDEAVAIANDSPFGLAGSVYTKDIGRGKQVASKIESGMVFINYPSISTADLPFGGIKRSGYGKELADLGIQEFVNRKMIVAPQPSQGGWSPVNVVEAHPTVSIQKERNKQSPQ